MDNMEFGAGPNPLSNSPGGGLGAYPIARFETPSLDLTVPHLGIELVPGKPGYISVIASTNWLIERVNGTQTTPLTCNAGSDAAHSNVIPSVAIQPTNADVNGANVPSLAAGQGQNALLKLIPGAPVILDITAGAAGTGSFALTGRYVVSVFYIAVGQ